MRQGKKGLLWPVLFTVLAVNLALFEGILGLAHPLWRDINGFLQTVTGFALPWALCIFILSAALVVCAALLSYRAVQRRKAGEAYDPGLAAKIGAGFVFIVWNGMLALLLSQMGREVNLLRLRFFELSGAIAFVALLMLLIFVLPLTRMWKNKFVRLGVFALVCAIFLGLSAGAGTPRVAAGPYLTAPGATSMTVGWVTKENCVSWVEYGQNGVLNQKAYRAEHGLIEANQTIHRVTIEGLAPGQTYEYRIASTKINNQYPYDVQYGKTHYGKVHRFTTLDPAKSETSFLVIADLHQNVELLSALLRAQGDRPYDFVVFNGDSLDYFTSERQLIESFLKPVSELFASDIPFIFVRGNHETRGKLARRLADYIGTPGGAYYNSFRQGPAQLLVLDTGEDKPDSHAEYFGLADFAAYREQEFAWLKGAVLAQDYREAAFRIAFAHIPVNEFQMEGEAGFAYQREWARALNESGLDLMLSGHHHINQSFEPAGEVGFPVLLSGGEAYQKGGFFLLRVDVRQDAIEVHYINEAGAAFEELGEGVRIPRGAREGAGAGR